MRKTARHILKANQVVPGDPLRLSLGAAARPGGTSPSCTASSPKVRVAQSHPEYAVIEVTCACGQTTYVRCEYAAANPG